MQGQGSLADAPTHAFVSDSFPSPRSQPPIQQHPAASSRKKGLVACGGFPFWTTFRAAAAPAASHSSSQDTTTRLSPEREGGFAGGGRAWGDQESFGRRTSQLTVSTAGCGVWVCRGPLCDLSSTHHGQQSAAATAAAPGAGSAGPRVFPRGVRDGLWGHLHQ